MKKPRQFLPLLKHMLGFYRVGPLPLALWLVLTVTALFFGAIAFPTAWMEWHTWPGSAGTGQLAFTFDAVFTLSLYLYLLLVSTYLPFGWLAGYTPLEFLFTRAIDRGIWLRTERTAILIIAAVPLMLSLLLSPLGPVLAFEPAVPGSTAAAMHERYIKTFPGSYLTASDASGQPEQLVIRHGTEMFAAWLAWSGVAAIFLVAGYFCLAFTAWQRAGWHHTRSKWRPWLGTTMVFTPILVPLFLLVVCAALRLNIYEESFLFFASHLLPMVIGLIVLILVVQPLSERNIRRKLEFEFF